MKKTLLVVLIALGTIVVPALAGPFPPPPVEDIPCERWCIPGTDWCWNSSC